MNQNIEEITFIFRYYQAGFSSCFIDSYQDGGSPLDNLDDCGFSSTAFFGNEPEKSPVALMGTPQFVRSNKWVLA
jgi:hypothetical protein